MDATIDSHVHIWTSDRDEYPRVPGELEYPPERFTPDDFRSHAQPNGVTRAVLVQMSFYGFDNSYMLDSMRAHAGVFSGIAIVNSEAPHADTAMRALAKAGTRGFRIAPGNSAPAELDTPGIQSMWRCGAEQRLAMCLLIDPEMLPAVDIMCERFPETPVVIDHLARIGIDGEIRESDIRLLCGLARHKHLYVKLSAFYALGQKQAPYTDLVPLIRRVYDAFGSARLMWASDCPFQVEDGHTYRNSLALVRDRLPFMHAEDRDWLLSRTAASVFFTA